MISKNARKILNFLAQKSKSISPLLILPHDFPDPDSLASSFALSYLAGHFGIESKIVYGGVIGRMENRAMVSLLKIPVKKLKPGDFKKHSYVALLDTQPAFENNSFPKNRKAAIVIDQHPSVTRPNAELAIVDSSVGATAVILAEAFLLLEIAIPVRIATALAYGILTDTLNLYRASQKVEIKTYLSILPYCDLKILAEIQNPLRSRKFFSTLGSGIQNAMVKRSLIISHLGEVENPDLVSQIADFLLTYKGVSWSFCTGRFKNKLYASLRASNPGVKAGEVLRDIFERRGQAGGHDVIAGGSIKIGNAPTEETWRSTEEFLGQRLLSRLRISQKSEFKYPFRKKQ